METFKTRKFCILLYPDEDKTHHSALEFIKLNYDYAYIIHDKDKDEKGNIKKSHTHVILSFTSAKYNTALAKELNISLNYIQRCRSLENALEYLIHFNEENKFQYDIENVHGTLKQKLVREISKANKDENEKVFELIEYIENYNGYLYCTNFSKYCASVGMWDVYRRAGGIFNEIIKEHNIYFSKQS